jgi:CRP/FNR family transcriptional regulator, cyclic AMP receptor protein
MRRADVPLLAALTAAERRRVVAAGEPRSFRRNEVVFHEGDPGDSLHVVLSGRLAVRVTTPLGDVATLSLLNTGQMFGELALLDPDARRTATVVALERTRTLALRQSVLTTLRTEIPSIDQLLTATLAGYVRRLSDMVLEAMYLPVEQRVRRQLVRLASIYGGDGPAAEIRLTQDDIASLAGTTRATANRVLRALETDGVLTLARARVVISDRSRLADSGGF